MRPRFRAGTIAVELIYNRRGEAFLRFQRVAPIHVSPHDPNRVYHTSQYVHVTENGGRVWQTISPDLTAFTPETQVVSGGPITIDVTGEEHFSVIYEIQESPHERGVLWVGANDGPIHISRDNGTSWKEVTPPGIGPHGRVQNIEVSPHQPSKAYAVILRYQLGDFSPHAYKTTDYGETWTRITPGTNGIPGDHPVRVVREDPDREGLLYAGTEFGMFISFDDGGSWQPFQLNLPVTPITDLKVVDKDLVMSTMGRSFWILYDLTPLHEVEPDMATESAHLFAVEDPYRVRASRRLVREAYAPDEPQYPLVGANIDYYLGTEPSETVSLEILDVDGTVIRSYSSDDSGQQNVSVDEAKLGDWQLERVGTAKLDTSPGLHRFSWPLRYPGPWHEDNEESGDDGPMVAPGTYRARLTVGDWTRTVSFEAKVDPRVVEEGVVAPEDIEMQTKLTLEVRDTLSDARLTAARVGRALEGATGAAKEAPENIHEELVTAPRRYSQPMLIDQLDYLYSNLDRADQRPGRDAIERYEEPSRQLDEQIARLDDVLGTTEDAADSF